MGIEFKWNVATARQQTVTRTLGIVVIRTILMVAAGTIERMCFDLRCDSAASSHHTGHADEAIQIALAQIPELIADGQVDDAYLQILVDAPIVWELPLHNLDEHLYVD
jgi:hypothetical protein